jgi:hypothetical protein
MRFPCSTHIFTALAALSAEAMLRKALFRPVKRRRQPERWAAFF